MTRSPLSPPVTARQYVIAFRAMGSQFNVWLETADDGDTILRQVPDWVETIEAALSRFRPASELSRLNARSGKWVAASDTLLQAVLNAQGAARLTGGLCNPLVLPALAAAGYTRSFEDLMRDGVEHGVGDDPDMTPVVVPDWRGLAVKTKHSTIRLPAGSQIDLGGTAKGWTAEQVADRLSVYGACLVDAGGDLVARAAPHDQPGWLVDVGSPGSDQPLATISVRDTAVATSGIDYRHWVKNGMPQHHLIDPRTGQPAVTDVLSATVIHPEAVLAEAYAKTLVLLGSDAGLDWLLSQPRQAALVVRRDGAVLATADFQAAIVELA